MDNLRFEVLKEAFRKRPVELKIPKERPSDLFGKNVFNREKMFKYLPIDVYNKMVDVMDNGETASAAAYRNRTAHSTPPNLPD